MKPWLQIAAFLLLPIPAFALTVKNLDEVGIQQQTIEEWEWLERAIAIEKDHLEIESHRARALSLALLQDQPTSDVIRIKSDLELLIQIETALDSARSCLKVPSCEIIYDSKKLKEEEIAKSAAREILLDQDPTFQEKNLSKWIQKIAKTKVSYSIDAPEVIVLLVKAVKLRERGFREQLKTNDKLIETEKKLGQELNAIHEQWSRYPKEVRKRYQNYENKNREYLHLIKNAVFDAGFLSLPDKSVMGDLLASEALEEWRHQGTFAQIEQRISSYDFRKDAILFTAPLLLGAGPWAFAIRPLLALNRAERVLGAAGLLKKAGFLDTVAMYGKRKDCHLYYDQQNYPEWKKCSQDFTHQIVLTLLGVGLGAAGISKIAH